MAILQQVEGQADFSLPAISVGIKVDLIIFDNSPQSFNKDVVAAALPA